jgi:hypothetical protein
MTYSLADIVGATSRRLAAEHGALLPPRHERGTKRPRNFRGKGRGAKKRIIDVRSLYNRRASMRQPALGGGGPL